VLQCIKFSIKSISVVRRIPSGTHLYRDIVAALGLAKSGRAEVERGSYQIISSNEFDIFCILSHQISLSSGPPTAIFPELKLPTTRPCKTETKKKPNPGGAA
jgi:hypothetical protein